MRHIITIALMLIAISTPSAHGQNRGTNSKKAIEVAAAVAPVWPDQKATVGKAEVQVTVTLDGYFGNVIETESKEPKSAFSDASERAARLWKFYPTKPNSKQVLTFVFEVFPRNDSTRIAATTFIPPYRVVVERPSD